MAALPFPDPPLTDGVVALRPWRDADALAKAAWGGDAEIVRWTGVPAGYTEAAARAWAASIEEGRRAGRALALAIVEARSDAVLGSCDIRRPDPEDAALGEIGYLLSAGARGSGYATQAIALLVEWGFRQLGMERVQALVHPDNARSARVLDRLGFHREGLVRAYRPGEGGREDRLLYSLLPGELVAPACGERA